MESQHSIDRVETRDDYFQMESTGYNDEFPEKIQQRLHDHVPAGIFVVVENDEIRLESEPPLVELTGTGEAHITNTSYDVESSISVRRCGEDFVTIIDGEIIEISEFCPFKIDVE